MTSRLNAMLAIYLGGALLGLTLVSFPSSSVYFVERLGLSDAQYGSIYLPQLVAAVVGALGGGVALRFMSLKAILVTAFACLLISHVALAASDNVTPEMALTLIMAATAFFGFGFGFGGGPMNGIASVLFEDESKANSAVTALHMMAGAGLAAGPLIFSRAIGAGFWTSIPTTLAAVAAALTLLALITRFPEPEAPAEEAEAASPSRSLYFWLMFAVAILYALAEGTFANWAMIYVQEGKGLDLQTAGLSLAGFWFALTLGRLFATILLVKVKPIALWICLPPMMALALFILPSLEGAAQVIAGFAFAGFACSAFFPLMVAVTAERHPHAISFIASMLTAALMVGVGIGSYVIGSMRGELSLDALFTYSIAYPIAALVLIIAARAMGRPQS